LLFSLNQFCSLVSLELVKFILSCKLGLTRLLHKNSLVVCHAIDMASTIGYRGIGRGLAMGAIVAGLLSTVFGFVL
jgi:hypothetical protein